MSRIAWCLPALALIGGGCYVDRSGEGLDGGPDAAPPAECERATDCDDGLFCNGAERCVAGSCASGTAPECGDAIACTVELCDEAADACARLPDHAVCAAGELCSTTEGCLPVDPCAEDADCDDGFACNGAERCDVDRCAPGAPPTCDDGVGCTVDACSESRGGCVSVPDPSACTGDEVCDLTEGCVPPTLCTGDGDCDDGNFCDGAETCVGGRCQPGTPPDCGDGVACTVDLCDEAADACVSTPDDARCSADHACGATGCTFTGECTGDADCDDGFFCNGAETCVGVTCVAGTPPSCGDAVACTADLCDEVAERCANLPDPSACGANETCDATLGCVPECTSAADCDDGLFCNGAEACVAGGCVAGTAPDCADSVACTVDVCDEAADACRQLPDDGRCGSSETCDATLGCVPECTSAADCDDGLFCNGAEACSSGACVPGTPPDCADSVACTIDVCDELADTCRNLADDARCTPPETCDATLGCVPECTGDPDCDDGLFCNGVETCVGGACAEGAAPDCSDGVACTVDLCDEVGDRCLWVPDDDRCGGPPQRCTPTGCLGPPP